MAQTFTIRQALQNAQAIMQAAAQNPLFSAAEQSQCTENVNVIVDVLGALPGSNIFPAGQRNGRANQLEGRVTATVHIEQGKAGIAPGDFYNGCDQMWDSAAEIRRGVASFTTTL